MRRALLTQIKEADEYRYIETDINFIEYDINLGLLQRNNF